MKEKIKNIIRRKTLVIPVFLAIVIALIIYGIGVQKNSSVSRDDYATENNEQILSDLGKAILHLKQQMRMKLKMLNMNLNKY